MKSLGFAGTRLPAAARAFHTLAKDGVSAVNRLNLGKRLLEIWADDKGLGYTNCFLADTVVGTEFGLRAIQDVRASDRVWAFDLVAGEWKLRHVIETYQHEHEGDVVAATVAGEVIESTGHHPWWVVRGESLDGRPQPEHVPGNPEAYRGEGRWVDAIDLRVGDVLLLRSGELAAITALVIRHARLPVYNFHVEELHCYAVGHVQALVHNNSSAAQRGFRPNFEHIDSSASSIAARSKAAELAGLGEDSIPFVSELGPQKGWTIGRQSKDGLRGWRMDWDPDKGYHVNWWDKTGGAKRKDWIYGAEKIEGGTWHDYIELLKHGFGN